MNATKQARAGAVGCAIWTCASLLSMMGCSDSGRRTFELESGDVRATVSYAPGPPAQVYDSQLVTVGFSVSPDPGTDSLRLDLVPAQGGWSRAVGSTLVRTQDGSYRFSVWLCPTVPGQFVLRWQTEPFTGFTYYLSAWYDSAGALVRWDETPDDVVSTDLPVVRDTMEMVYQYWPQVFYRRVHLVRRADTQRVFWVITESLQCAPGVSGRVLRATANLRFDPEYPLRSRRWREPGWVADTLSVWVRDTLVAWLSWDYDEFVDNWEPGELLFRQWQHKAEPEFYFQVDTRGHLAGVWRLTPAGKYIAAKMLADTSKPEFEVIKREFITGDPGPP